MNIAGIVAEYNPFHWGHARHLQLTKESLGEDSLLVCVLSGDFVQRGEAAILSKFARAEAACRCGVDLVLELPLPWCLSSAEGFARGAVSLLDRIGCTHLSFGSELGELAPLRQLSTQMLAPDFQALVSNRMKAQANLSYATAREQVLTEIVGESAALLHTPNNILALEYLKALQTLHSSMQPLTIRREGSSHDGEGDEHCSASELRRMLYEGADFHGLLPPDSEAVLRREMAEGRGLPDKNALEISFFSRLLAMGKECFDDLPDGADGLGRRLYEAVRTQTSCAAIAEYTKTKRYALSRVRRLMCSAVLGVKAGMAATEPPYARVLAFGENGRRLLRAQAESVLLPIVTKPASVLKIGSEAAQHFTLGADAHDLFVLSYPDHKQRVMGEDWKRGPFIL